MIIEYQDFVACAIRPDDCHNPYPILCFASPGELTEGTSIESLLQKGSDEACKEIDDFVREIDYFEFSFRIDDYISGILRIYYREPSGVVGIYLGDKEVPCSLTNHLCEPRKLTIYDLKQYVEIFVVEKYNTIKNK